MAQVIFGDHNPAGRLPITWYGNEYADQVVMTNMKMRANKLSNFPGRSYRFYTDKPVCEFVHGLSKIKVSIPSTVVIPVQSPDHIIPENVKAIDMSAISCEGLHTELVIGVRNNGPMSRDNVVLVFWRPMSSVRGAPNVSWWGLNEWK